jgi:hypothetical protein
MRMERVIGKMANVGYWSRTAMMDVLFSFCYFFIYLLSRGGSLLYYALGIALFLYGNYIDVALFFSYVGFRWLGIEFGLILHNTP